MSRCAGLKRREVINCDTAERIGYVSDIEIDEKNGQITAIVVMRNGVLKRALGIGEFLIPWSAVTAISDDFVLTTVYKSD